MARATFSGGHGNHLQLEVVSGWNSQNIEGNYSIVNIQVRLIADGYAKIWGAEEKTLTINVGDIPKQVSIDASISPGQTRLIYAEDFQVPHNSDGTKSVYITANLAINQGKYGWAAVGINIPLSNIARASTGSSANGVIGQAITLNISRHSDSFKHSIWVRFGNYDKKIAGDNIDTSFTWTPEMSMCNEIPDANVGHGTLTYITYNNDKEVGRNSQTVTLSVPDAVKPRLTGITLTDTNTAVARIVPGEQDFISILSNIKVNFGQATGAYGSVIAGYRAEIVDKRQSTNQNGGTLGIMDYTGAVTIRASVTDSRGRTSNAIEKRVNILEYFAPVLNFNIARSGANSDILTIRRNAKVASLTINGSQKNKMTLSFKVAPINSSNYVNDTGSASGIWTTISSLTNSNANLQGTYAANQSWSVVGVLEDLFTRTEFSKIVGTEAVVLSYGKDKIGFGKIAEISNTVDSEWEYYFKGNPIQNRKLTNPDGRSLTNIYKTVDEYVTTGFYYVDDKKLPDPVGGYLLVESYSVDFIKQTYTPWNKSYEFTRLKKGKDKPWTAWISPALEQCYPIGAIYQSTEATNPATFMGGTWERFGNGKTLIGVDEGDSDFNTSHKIGGAKTHDHGDGTYEAMIGSNGQDISSIGYQASNKNDDVLNNSTATYKVVGTSMGAGRNFNHFTRITGRSANSSSLQPYITIYRWRRIA